MSTIFCNKVNSLSCKHGLNSHLIFLNLIINGATAVSGEQVDGAPVIICRVKYNDVTKIGKVVFFTGKQGRTEDACDIGVDAKKSCEAK